MYLVYSLRLIFCTTRRASSQGKFSDRHNLSIVFVLAILNFRPSNLRASMCLPALMKTDGVLLLHSDSPLRNNMDSGRWSASVTSAAALGKAAASSVDAHGDSALMVSMITFPRTNRTSAVTPSSSNL